MISHPLFEIVAVLYQQFIFKACVLSKKRSDLIFEKLPFQKYGFSSLEVYLSFWSQSQVTYKVKGSKRVTILGQRPAIEIETWCYIWFFFPQEKVKKIWLFFLGNLEILNPDRLTVPADENVQTASSQTNFQSIVFDVYR